MSLLQLPPEILHIIVGYARPEGLEPLMLTCKQAHNSCKPFLSEHNDLKRLFSTLAIHNAESAPDTGTYLITENLVEIVHSFARRPELGWYVKHLDIRYGHRPSKQSQEALEWVRKDRRDFEGSKSSQDASKPTQELIQKNPWLKAAGLDIETWTNRAPQLWPLVDNPNNIRPESEDFTDESWLYLFVLLLTRLSRLQTLHGDHSLLSLTQDTVEYPLLVLDLMSCRVGNNGSFYSNEHVRDTMEPGQRAMIRKSVRLVSPLEHLEEVRLSLEPDYDDRASSSNLDAFLTSPHVRKVFTTNLVAVFDSYTGIPYTWPGANDETSSLLGNRHWGGIEHLELLGCCVDAEGLGNIVSRLPFLKTFRLAFQTKWHGCQHHWSAGEVVQALAKCDVPDVANRDDQNPLDDGRTLGKRRLAPQITDLAINVINHFGAIITGVSDSLHEFTSLKRLSVDLTIFFGPTIESGERIQTTEDYVEPTAQGATPWKCDELHVPRLIDLIPAGIEELELVCREEMYEKYENWGILLRGFAEEKGESLPNLRKFTLCGERLIEKAKEVGLGEFVKDNTSDIAQWQVDFAKREGWVG